MGSVNAHLHGRLIGLCLDSVRLPYAEVLHVSHHACRPVDAPRALRLVCVLRLKKKTPRRVSTA